MTVFESWKDSLKLLKPEAVKLFMLVTLKSMYEAMRTLTAVWFLVPVVLIVAASFLMHGVSGIVIGLSGVLPLASLFFLIAARPSVGQKDFRYFMSNMRKVLWLILVSSASAFLLMSPAIIPATRPVLFSFIAILSVVYALLLGPIFFDLAILFHLDTKDGVWAAFKRALSMIWYNYPLFVIYVGVLFILNGFIIGLLPSPIASLLSADVVTPFLLVMSLLSALWFAVSHLFIRCLVLNLYIKRVHDQFELYK